MKLWLLDVGFGALRCIVKVEVVGFVLLFVLLFKREIVPDIGAPDVIFVGLVVGLIIGAIIRVVDVVIDKWYCKAAEGGDAQAPYRLGVRYYKGDGVAQDKAEAAKWYRKAAEQGYQPAKEKLKALQE